MLEEIFRSTTSRAGTIRVSNALNPLLWASAVAAPASWFFAYLFRDDLFLRYGLGCLGALPIISTVVAYFVYMCTDRDRLQSEEFVLRQKELSIIERKGAPAIRYEPETGDDMSGTADEG